MTLSRTERARLKDKIASSLSELEKPRIDLILIEFDGQYSYGWSGDMYSYVSEMLHNPDDETLQELAAYISEHNSEIKDLPNYWRPNHLRVFLSHLAKNKIYASELQSSLKKYGISAFVAHEDIEPDTAWQNEILNALKTCEALIAILHDGFNESKWTDQEIGFALGRTVPVFSLRIDTTPYGLFGSKQAFNAKSKDTDDIAYELFIAFQNHPSTKYKMADIIIDQFSNSTSWATAKKWCGYVEGLSVWKNTYANKLAQANRENSEIKGAYGVPDRINRLIIKKEGFSSESDDEIPF